MRVVMASAAALAATMVTLTAAHVTPGLPQSPRTSVHVYVDGGNAVVFSDDGTRADVGPVKPRRGAKGVDFNKHLMTMVLERGQRDTGRQFMKPAGKIGQDSVWNLRGYEVVICPGGTCPGASSLQPAPSSTPANACDAPQGSTGRPIENLYYVPDMLALHPGSQLVPDWKDRLNGHVVLQQGRLVSVTTVGCFTFRDPSGKTLRPQPLVNGDSGLRNEFETNEAFVDLQFRKDGRTAGTVRLTPEKSGGTSILQLHIRTKEPSDERMNKDGSVTHFLPFYELLQMPQAASSPGIARMILLPTPDMTTAPQNVNPGGECPMARFGGPRPRP